MRIAAIILLLLVGINLQAQSLFTNVFSFVNSSGVTQNVKQVSIEPLQALGVYGDSVIVPDVQKLTVKTNTLPVPLLNGYSYRVKYYASVLPELITATFTNYFATNVSGVVSAADYVAISTNLGNGIYAYSQAQSDARFALAGSSGTPTNINALDFLVSSTNTQPWREGRVYYDQPSHTLAYFGDKSNVTVNIGQETHLRGMNLTGSTISNGVAVTITQGNGSIPRIALAQATTNSAAIGFDCVGLATEDIAQGQEGLITILGTVHGIDTDSWITGSTVYLGTNAGSYTTNPPPSNYARVIIGAVARGNGNNGDIFVMPQQAVHPSDITAAPWLTNGASGVTLSGTFSGDGTGLTNTVARSPGYDSGTPQSVATVGLDGQFTAPRNLSYFYGTGDNMTPLPATATASLTNVVVIATNIPAASVSTANNVATIIIGTNSGSGGASGQNYYSTNNLPFDSDWNASAMPIPTVSITTWGGWEYDSDMTNAVRWITLNQLPVTEYMMDTGIGIAARSNGLPYWNTNRFKTGLPAFSAYLNSQGMKSAMWLATWTNANIIGGGMTTNATWSKYQGSPEELLLADLKAVQDWGIGSIVFDRYGTAPSNRPAYSHSIMSIFANWLEERQASTNIYGNAQYSETVVPIPLTHYAVSKDKYNSMANSLSYGGDIWLNANAPFPLYTGAAAELNYRAWWAIYTNSALWVKPGNYINAIGHNPATSAFDSTNCFNFYAMASACVKLEGLIGSGLGAYTIMSGVTNPANVALGNEELCGIWFDKLGRMGLPVKTWPAVDATVELWVKRLENGNKSAMLWNHSTNTTQTVYLSCSDVDSSWWNFNVRDVWAHSYAATLTNTLAVTLAPMQTVIYRCAGNQTALGSYNYNWTNLVSWWLMNDGAGGKLKDWTGNSGGMSVREYKAVLGGRQVSPHWTNDNGIVAMAFTNTSAYIPGTYIKKTSWPSNAITVTGWIKPYTSISSDAFLINSMNSYGVNAGDSFSLNCKNTANKINFWVSTTAGVPATASLSTVTMSAGNWYFLAGTYDGSTLSVSINASNRTEVSTNISWTRPTPNNNPITLGNVADASRTSYQGAMADVKIYDRCLTSNELSAMYQAGIQTSVTRP